MAVLLWAAVLGLPILFKDDGTEMGYDSESNTAGSSIVDVIAIPFFKLALEVINLAKDFSPVEALSTGRSITWTDLARAFVQIIFVMGGVLSAFGIWAFERRELAVAQNQS